MVLPEGEEHWQQPAPPLHTNIGYNARFADTHTEQMNSKDSLKGGGRVEKQTFWISMPFFFSLTFGSKYTRQTADVELCRQGIEVSHRRWCTVPQGPARWDKTSLSQRLGGCRCDGGGVKKKQKTKTCHASDGLTSWRAVIRPAY